MRNPSTTPYLIRAIYEWCVDNGFTPYLAVRVDGNTRVPMEYVRNGEIVLNVSADATRDLTMGNEGIRFSARFNGVSREISVPVEAVSGIFAKETGQGLAFEQPSPIPVISAAAPETPPPDDDRPTPPSGRPKLQVVK